MGFLSRRSRPAENQVEEETAPQSAPEPIEQPPEDGGEIRISRGEEAAPRTSQPEPQAEPEPQPQPDPEPVPEQAATEPSIESATNAFSAANGAGATAEPDSPPRMRLRPDELIAPSRHGGEEEGEDSEAPVAKVISFANQKGGVAKTTTTLNLAVAFAESGYRVLCIDLDPQGNLTMSQGIDPDKVEKSMYDVLVHDIPLSEVVQKREIDIAVASIDLAGAEIAMSTKIGRERSLEKAVKAVRHDYDFICIDTPPSLGLLTINALTASDKVIVPVQCEYLSMRGLVQLQNTLKMIQENLNPGVEIEGILPTMLDSRTVHAKEAVEILEENFGDLVFRSRIRKAIKFAEAPVRGASVLKYDPDGNAASYYRELANEVLTDVPA